MKSEGGFPQGHQTFCHCALVGHAVFPETSCQDTREKKTKSNYNNQKN